MVKTIVCSLRFTLTGPVISTFLSLNHLYISRSALKEGSDFLTIEDLEAYGPNSHIAQLKIMDFLRWNESYFCLFERKLHLKIYSKKIFVLLDFPDLTSPSICVNPLKCSILNLSLSLEIPILSIELGRFWGPSCILFSLEPFFLIPGFVALVLCE